MNAPVLATKRCAACGEVKNLAEFHRNRANKDGHQPRCKPCQTASVIAAKRRRRIRLGDAEYLAQQRETVRRHRERTNGERDRAYSRAVWLATAALRERHRVEYEHLLLLARRGELETATP